MCEIIRAAIAGGKFNTYNLNMQRIPVELLDLIDCPGSPEKNGPKICAASHGSYFDQKSWSIFLKPSAISVSLSKIYFLLNLLQFLNIFSCLN